MSKTLGLVLTLALACMADNLSAAGVPDITIKQTPTAIREGQPITGRFDRASETGATYLVTITATDELGQTESASFIIPLGRFVIPTNNLEPGIIKITALDSDGHTEVKTKEVSMLKQTLQPGPSAVALKFRVIVGPGQPKPPVSYDRVRFTLSAFARPEGGSSAHTGIVDTGLAEFLTTNKHVANRLYTQKTVVELSTPRPATFIGAQVTQTTLYTKAGVSTDLLTENLTVDLP